MSFPVSALMLSLQSVRTTFTSATLKEPLLTTFQIAMIRPIMQSQYDVLIKPLDDSLVKKYSVDGYHEFFFTQALPVKRLIYVPDPWLHEEVVEALDVMIKGCVEGFYINIGYIGYTRFNGFSASLVTAYFDVSNDQFRYAISENGIVQEYSYGKVTDSLVRESQFLYSKSSDWAIYTDPVGFLLLAGKPNIIQAFDQAFSLDYMAQVRDFLTYCKMHDYVMTSLEMKPACNWLLRLMIHVFGRQQGIKLLEEAGMFVENLDDFWSSV
jgi:hypothetical protein